MQGKTFIPFSEIGERKNVIIVDGQHAQGFVLSHWRGANNNAALEADTSADIVLNALLQKCPELDFSFVTATHFDIDGFVGIWSLFYPEKAFKYEEILRQTAKLGDFRHFNPKTKEGLTALKLCCWINKVEASAFYRPYGSEDELDDCVAKFEYFLPIFGAVLENPEACKTDWIEEYEQVLNDCKQLEQGTVEQYPELGLVIKKTEKPIHYYALFSDTENFDMVLTMYSDNRYELEMKYTTWVDIVSRPTLPRLNLKPLTIILNQLEKSSERWYCDKISDTGPILRLEKEGLSKADRYANPTEREIFSSSIDPQQFEKIVLDYLNKAYAGVKPKSFWTWKELREFELDSTLL